MDPDLQRTAEAEVLRAVRGIEARQGRVRRIGLDDDEALQGAVVALDPSTGQVRAGGRSKLR